MHNSCVALLYLAVGASASALRNPSCARALSAAGDRLAELSAELLADVQDDPLLADGFCARAEGVRVACAGEFDRRCAGETGRVPFLARMRASRELTLQTGSALAPALFAQLQQLAEVAMDDFEEHVERVVPGTEAYAPAVLKCRREVQRTFRQRAHSCVPRALRATPLRGTVRDAAARIDAHLGELSERLVELSPPMAPQADSSAEKWYRRLAWQLLAIAVNLLQAQLQDWWGRRAQMRAQLAARGEPSGSGSARPASPSQGGPAF